MPGSRSAPTPDQPVVVGLVDRGEQPAPGRRFDRHGATLSPRDLSKTWEFPRWPGAGQRRFSPPPRWPVTTPPCVPDSSPSWPSPSPPSRSRPRRRRPRRRPTTQVSTKDHVLVARHENEIGGTTDVASRSERIGVYPETKHPTYFDSIGLSLEEPLVATLEANGYRNLRRPGVHPVVRGRQPAPARHDDPACRWSSCSAPRASRSTSPPPATRRGTPTWRRRRAWPRFTTYADGISVDETMVIQVGANGDLGASTSLVADSTRRRDRPHLHDANQTFVPPALRTSADPAAGQRRGGVRGLLGRGASTAVQRQRRHGGSEPPGPAT